MATAAVISATQPWKMESAYDFAAIAGIGRPLRETDLVLGSNTYNNLTPIEKQVTLQVSHFKHVKDVLAIISKHGMGGLFDCRASPGIDGMNWTRATPIDSELLAQDKIHATFFKVEGSTLVPFEFAEGPSPLKGHDIPPQLIFDVAKYLVENGLTDLISIEVKDFAKACAGGDKRTSELDVVWGTTESLTVVLPFDRMVKGVTNPVPTGWNVQDYDPASDPDRPGPGEHWNEATKSDGSMTHKVYVDSVEPISPEFLHDSLVEQGYVVKA